MGSTLGVGGYNPLSADKTANVVLHLFPERIRDVLEHHTSSKHYASWVTALSFLLTLTASVPFGSVLVTAILLNAKHWKRLVIGGSLAAAAASMCLLVIFNSLGWEQLAAHFPDLVQSKAWARATGWISAYGVAALYLIAALPVPQTPVLVFCAITDLPLGPAFVALLLGKLTKYGVYGFLTATSPKTVIGLAERLGVSGWKSGSARQL